MSFFWKVSAPITLLCACSCARTGGVLRQSSACDAIRCHHCPVAAVIARRRRCQIIRLQIKGRNMSANIHIMAIRTKSSQVDGMMTFHLLISSVKYTHPHQTQHAYTTKRIHIYTCLSAQVHIAVIAFHAHQWASDCHCWTHTHLEGRAAAHVYPIVGAGKHAHRLCECPLVTSDCSSMHANYGEEREIFTYDSKNIQFSNLIIQCITYWQTYLMIHLCAKTPSRTCAKFREQKDGLVSGGKHLGPATGNHRRIQRRVCGGIPIQRKLAKQTT